MLWEKEYIQFYTVGVSKIDFSIQEIACEGEYILYQTADVRKIESNKTRMA